jgi:hypothetical protein
MWTPLAWPSANLVLYRPKAGCAATSSDALVWIGREFMVDVRFVPAHPATIRPGFAGEGCMDCMHAESELVDTLHGIRIEHRRGGIAATNALFTTRIMPCNDTVVVRVEVITPIDQPRVGLRLVNSARITEGGRCVGSSPLDGPDTGR